MDLYLLTVKEPGSGMDTEPLGVYTDLEEVRTAIRIDSVSAGFVEEHYVIRKTVLNGMPDTMEVIV